MNVKLVKGYLLAVVSLVILVAAAFLLVNNLGEKWAMQVYWKRVTLPTPAWLLLAAGGGVVVYWTLRKLLPAAIASLRAGSAARRAKQAPAQGEKPLKDRRP